MANLTVFSEEAARRVAETVEWVDRRPPTVNPYRERPPSSTDAPAPEVQVVRVTSTTLGAYGYPGFVSLLHTPVANPPTFDDGAACWVVDPNGSAPLAQFYVARRTTVSPDADGNKPIFEVAGSGSGSITAKLSDNSLVVNGVNTLIFNVNDFVGGNPGMGQFQVTTRGYTGNFTAVMVSSVFCNAGTLTVGTSTLTIPIRDGLIFSAPTFM